MQLTRVTDWQPALAEAQQNDYNIGICARVKNSEGQLLLIKRAKDQPYAGIWEMPGGGVETNDKSLLAALSRELHEEIGLSETPATLLGYFDFTNIETGKTKRKFCFTVSSDAPVVLDEDHDEYRWFTKEQIKTLKRESQDEHYEIWDDHYQLLLDES